MSAPQTYHGLFVSRLTENLSICRIGKPPEGPAAVLLHGIAVIKFISDRASELDRFAFGGSADRYHRRIHRPRLMGVLEHEVINALAFHDGGDHLGFTA